VIRTGTGHGDDTTAFDRSTQQTPAIQVSTQFGNPTVWPGDTFGLSAPTGGDSTYPATRVVLSWGGGQTDSQIYARVVHLPPTPAG